MKKKNVKILVLTDDVSLQLTGKPLLKQLFPAVIFCDDADQLKEYLFTQLFDLIILDMDFQKSYFKDQEELYWLKRILLADPLNSVVMLMSSNQADRTVECLKAGASDFILKPWNREKLEAVTSKVLKVKNSPSPINTSPLEHESRIDIPNSKAGKVLPSIPDDQELEEMEIMLIRKTMDKFGRDLTETALDIGLTPEELKEKIARYGI